MFTDKIEIEVRAGKGGDGKLSFRHERFVAKGGPDGGDGGKGGDVVFEVDHNLNTLAFFRNHRRIEAESGKNGDRAKRAGKKGEDVVIKVPPGTAVLEAGRLAADLAQVNQRFVVAKGGRGGFGNARFASSVRQAPRLAELGEPGERRQLTLELKLVADVGIAGLPNSGKSTLLSVISNAKPEIADYPFTTLVPNLGVVETEDFSFVAADIPGLIEGASRGKGLGDEFLRHIERTAVLWHLVDGTAEDPVKDWQTVIKELKAHSLALAKKPQLVVLTKIDALDKKAVEQKTAALKRTAKLPVFSISAVAKTGLLQLLNATKKPVKQARSAHAKAQTEAVPVIDESILEDDTWQVRKTGREFVVSGVKIERFASRINFDQPDAVERLRRWLVRQGVAKELSRRGAKPGDKVRIGAQELEWT